MQNQVRFIVEAVKVALDENRDATPLLTEGDIDTLTLDDIIRSKIIDAAKSVILDAPHYMLDKVESFADSKIDWVSSTGYGQGNILLPGTFLRLGSFQMSDWSYPVTEPITDSHPAYAMQFSRFAGVKGNPQKPVVAIVRRDEGLVLQFFSCTEGESVAIKQATYIPMPTEPDRILTDYDGILLPERLYRPTIYYIAYLVLLTLKEADAAAIMLNISKDLLR